MSKPLNWMQIQDIRAAITEIDIELEARPAFSNNDQAWKARQQYNAALAERLGGVGLTVLDNWNGGVVRMHGVRATSTSGIVGALQNWKRAATARIPA